MAAALNSVRRDPHALRKHLLLLIGTLPSPTTDNSDPESKAAVYEMALRDLPTWTGIAACAVALRGKIGAYSGRYLPSPGELHEYAEKLLAPVVAEKVRVDRVLLAKVADFPSEADRRAALARVQAAAQSIVRTNSVASQSWPGSRKDAEAALASADPNRPAPPLSESLRRKMGLSVEDREGAE